MPAGRGETILVVEDDEGVRSMTITMLDKLGYRVDAARTGQSALDRLRASDRIDLLLTDVVLPGKPGGAELAKMAADIRPGLKVLFMSGYTQNGIIHHGRLDPGVELLQKPFRRLDLARKVRSILDSVR